MQLKTGKWSVIQQRAASTSGRGGREKQCRSHYQWRLPAGARVMRVKEIEISWDEVYIKEILTGIKAFGAPPNLAGDTKSNMEPSAFALPANLQNSSTAKPISCIRFKLIHRDPVYVDTAMPMAEPRRFVVKLKAPHLVERQDLGRLECRIYFMNPVPKGL